MAAQRYKVLIVDDSIVIRTFLKDLFADLPDFEVIGAAAHPYKARDLMRRNWPDVITLDVEMPRMNGIEFLKKVMHTRPTPVVMISTLTRDRAAVTLEALALGALDYFPKPRLTTWESLAGIKEEIIKKVRNAVTSNIKKRGVIIEETGLIESSAASADLKGKLVLIGSSTGGVHALSRIFSRLPRNCPPIAVVQHMPPQFVDSLADQLGKKSLLDVRVANDNGFVRPGQAVISPGKKHLEVMKGPRDFFTRVLDGNPVGFHIPSVNVLFLSGARIGGPDVLGIILTGMGEDGAQGILQMKMNRCRTIGQDRETSVVYGMPKRAFEMGALEQQVPVLSIPEKIVQFGEGRL